MPGLKEAAKRIRQAPKLAAKKSQPSPHPGEHGDAPTHPPTPRPYKRTSPPWKKKTSACACKCKPCKSCWQSKASNRPVPTIR